MNVVHFGSARPFRAWLANNHLKTSEVWLGFYKKSTKKKGITYAEALDEALCFGWIDGVRYSVDEESYTIRFTPRKRNSVWSLVNVRHVERLKSLGKMTNAGLRVFEMKAEQRTGIYAFEQKRPGLSPRYRKIIQANAEAWKFFSAQAPWYRRTAGYWVSSAKQEETKVRRLKTLIEDSAHGRRLARLTPKAKRTRKDAKPA